MSIKCKNCSELWSRTQAKNCPKCGCSPSGVVPAAPGTAFNIGGAGAFPLKENTTPIEGK
jgi:hypothetical protein